MQINTNTLPQDFQQLLLDLGIDDEVVTARIGKPSNHFSELNEITFDSWGAEDIGKANEYIDIMASSGVDAFPPLIADCEAGLLRDGYHRLHAMRMLGINECWFIYLQEHAVQI